MNVFSIDFTVAELQLLRQSLDVITISGRDAKIIAMLQTKLETEIATCNALLLGEQTKKIQDPNAIAEPESKRKANTK